MKEEFEKDVSRNMKLFLSCMYNQICLNDIVIGVITDAFSVVKKSSLYRHEVKMVMNQVERKIKSYERKVNRLTSKYSESYANANDAFFTEDLEDAVKELRACFENDLNEAKVPYAYELSWLQLVQTMLEYSNCSRKQREKDLNKATHRGWVYFNSLDLSDVLNRFNCVWSHIKINVAVDLNTEKNREVFRRIDKMCVDVNRIANTIKEMTNESED